MARNRSNTKVQVALSLDDYTYDILRARFINVSQLINENQSLLERYDENKFNREFVGNTHIATTTVYPEVKERFKELGHKNFSKFVRFCVHEKFGDDAK